jgi:hypothetical protein
MGCSMRPWGEREAPRAGSPMGLTVLPRNLNSTTRNVCLASFGVNDQPNRVDATKFSALMIGRAGRLVSNTPRAPEPDPSGSMRFCRFTRSDVGALRNSHGEALGGHARG